MYIEDRPIESKDQDILGRQRFASKLAESLCRWEDKGSLVVALYGKWGSGKSSLLNLMREYIADKPKNKRPTKIDFNPWMVSGQSELYMHFFNEISQELELRNEYESDKKLAIRLRAYGQLLSMVPEPSSVLKTVEKLILGAGIIGVIASNLLSNELRFILLLFSVLILCLRFSGNLMKSIAGFLDERLKLKEKSLASMKTAIVDELKNRERKLLVILDDIDRLSQDEAKLIFQLIKVNSDFPNTIFLVAFDRPVVEKQLNQQNGVSGHDFLEKIVQVHFDIPDANRKRVEQYLFKQLDATLASLPERSQKLFDKKRWGNLYYSGLNQLFQSIRHIKRYINSLRFNFTMLVNSGTLEVNPIDFMAIEAIRVFCPDYYEFMKSNKELFTTLESNSMSDSSHSGRQSRQTQASNSLDMIDEKHKEQIKGILDRVFPGVFDNTIYAEDWWAEWSRNLRARHPDYYDAYFTLTPGGDEGNISQYEMDSILESIQDIEKLKTKFLAAIESGKIRQILQRFEAYTSDSESIPKDNFANLIQVLFDIAEELPEEETSEFDSGAMMDIQRILYQLSKRENDPEYFGAILKECIESALALPAAVWAISFATPRGDDQPKQFKMVRDEDLIGLQQACVVKIKEAHADGSLFNSSSFLYILYKWKQWGADSSLTDAINSWIGDDDWLVKFLCKFSYVQKSQIIGDYMEDKEDKFNFKELSDFTDLTAVRDRIRHVVEANAESYQNNKEVIDLFLAGIDQHIPKKGDDNTGPGGPSEE